MAAEPAFGHSTRCAVTRAVEQFRRGGMVIIVDDEDRENEGDLALAAEHVSAEAINFMATHGRGLICLAMQGQQIDRLQIPMMVPEAANQSGFGTGFTVSVEARRGVTTGISAADRAHTIRTLIDPASTTGDIAMPGHVFPLRAREGGVLERRGQTEASVDLARLAGLTPAGVICEVMDRDGTMLRLPGLRQFAERYGLPLVSVEALAAWRREHESPRPAAPVGTLPSVAVRHIATSRLPTVHGEFDVHVFRDAQGLEHSALMIGDVQRGAPLVRLHSECLTGDVFGSVRCDCGEQLAAALSQMAAYRAGALLYLRQEGRGIGLGNKICAYALQDQGLDTVEANEKLGFPADARRYDVAVSMLRQLSIRQVRLLSNNPNKRAALETGGIEVVARVPLVVAARPTNRDYLATKARRMGHEFAVEHNGVELETGSCN